MIVYPKIWQDLDLLIISPGIPFLYPKPHPVVKLARENSVQVTTDIELFFDFLHSKSTMQGTSRPTVICVTGSNGKSTTTALIHHMLTGMSKDSEMGGNIGTSVMDLKTDNPQSIKVIELSSYQIEISGRLEPDIAIFLNISNDHLERHGNFKNYIKAKFKIIKNQSKKNYAFIENNNKFLNYLIKKNKIKSKITRVNFRKYKKYFKLINNNYFKNNSNTKNLSFIFALSKCLKLNSKKIIKVTNKFKGLNFRQQIIHNSKKMIIINDSKSTSLSSTKPLLESFENIYWILGGQSKKGDKLKLNRKFFGKITAFIYGKDKTFFSKVLKKKIKYKIAKNLNESLYLIYKNIKKDNYEKKVIIFSPSAASFDQFRNFEDRGKYFNKLIKKYIKKYRTI